LQQRHTQHLFSERRGDRRTLLIGTQRKSFHRPFNALSRSKVHLLKIDLAGFDLGKVEDVIDHAQQGIGG
jgi:hypothetical protein